MKNKIIIIEDEGIDELFYKNVWTCLLYKELVDEINLDINYIKNWTLQGIRLINVNDAINENLTDYLIVVLWGKNVHLRVNIDGVKHILCWSHPRDGKLFIDCDNFNKINAILDGEKYDRINWDPVWRPVVYVSTDGACTGNGTDKSRGAWAYCIINESDIQLPPPNCDEIDCYEDSGLICDNVIAISDDSGCRPRPTNNRAELYAILEALKRIKEEVVFGEFRIISDSKYCIGSISLWSDNWIKNGTIKKNMDLIIDIKELLAELKQYNCKYSFIHTRGHLKEPANKKSNEWLFWFLNDRVDKAAQKKLS